MDELRSWIADIWAVDMARAALRSGLILVGGLLLMNLVNRRMRGWSLQAQHRLIVRRLTSGIILVLTAAWIMSELGLKLSVVLGAAGVLTVAVGFAAQTSFSNLISGIFLMAEQPFRIGDIIEVDTFSGEVLSIDLLSVKICTFNNLQVRIPNETMLKANVITLTRFAIRRHEFRITLPYEQDLDEVRTLLLGVAARCPHALQNPAPQFLFQKYTDAGFDIQFAVWAERAQFLDMRTEIAIEAQRAFAAAGVSFATAQRTLHLSKNDLESFANAITARQGPPSEPAAADN